MDEKRTMKLVAVSLIFLVWGIIVGILGLRLKDTQKRLTELERGTSEASSEQQEQIDMMRLDIEDLWLESDQVTKSLEEMEKDISETRTIQRNTNSAITRLRRKQEELEKELKEMKERLESIKQERSLNAKMSDIGVFILTAYEWTGSPCANGNFPTVGYTCASNYFPLGTRLLIGGLGERVVEDTGGMGMDVIDIYLGDVEACYQFGVQMAQVQVIGD